MGRGPVPREVQVSKKIAWLLRHGAEKEGLTMNAAGFANVQDVLNNQSLRSLKVTLPELQAIVESNDKKRFSIVPVSTLPDDMAAGTARDDVSLNVAALKPSELLIRANQGHSIAVESESLLTKIDETDMPNTCVHGTTHGAWPLIVSTGGLKPMTRRHIHFASGLPTGFKSLSKSEAGEATTRAPVISGMRNSSTVLIYVDVAKAIQAGVKFWKSENGVILTEGDASGLLPLSLLSRVEDRTGGQGVLLEDGKILKEYPPAWEKKGAGPGSRHGQQKKPTKDAIVQAESKPS